MPTKEAGRVGRNFAAVVSAHVFSQVLTFVVALTLARTLGVELYGVFVFGFAFPSWFLLLISLGLNSVLAIEVARDRSKASSLLTTIAALRLLLLPVAIAFLWFSVRLLLADPFAQTITLILGTASVLQTFAGTFTSVFQAFERLEFGALVEVVERTVTVTAILALVVLGFGLYEISVAFVVGSIVSLGLSVAIVRRRFTWFTREIDLRTLWRILTLGAPFALGAAVATFRKSAGLVLLTVLQDPVATGFFNAAFNILLALLAFLSLYHLVLLPMMSRIHRETPDRLSMILQRSQKLFFVLGLPAALGGWLFAEEIMTLFYGEAFRDSAGSFEVLILSLVIYTATVGNGTALAATGYQRLNLFTGIAAAITTVGLSFAWIPSWGHVGAALAFLVGALLRGGLGQVMVRRLVARTDLWGTFSRPTLAGAAMFLVLYVWPGLSLWLGILVGASVYFLILYLAGGVTKEDWTLVMDALRGGRSR